LAEAPRIVIVGGGLAGLMTAIRVSELGGTVDLLSLVPVKRSHSVCAQGGINGAVNTKGEGDSTWEHFDDTVYGGDFLNHQPPVKAMCEAAPGIIYMLDRMGVPFDRTPEGLIDFRRFGGTKHHRTAFSGATTGQQLMYALDEQVRRWEVAGRVSKYEGWDFVRLILDEDGRCRGVVGQHLSSLEFRAFPGDAVVLATGGCGLIFGRSTNSIINDGSAVSTAYQQGAIYGNPEFIQVHPTAIVGEDKLRLMSESLRGEGGRVWVPSDGQDGRPPKGKPWYFLEDWYPAYGNLVPRDVATRAIFKVVVDMKLGVDGRYVYLDVTEMPKERQDKIAGVLEIYEKFVGDDPRTTPMKVFPAMHYTMGGLWVDYDDMSNIPGLFVGGEANFQYHGANRLGANSLVSCIFDGFVAGPAAVRWAEGRSRAAGTGSGKLYEDAVRAEEAAFRKLLKMDGPENTYRLQDELGQWMTENVTVVRDNQRLKKTDEKLQELIERWSRVGLHDRSTWENQEAVAVRHTWNMLQQARAITLGALLRDESRGAHYKPAFPRRDDERFLKTTLATWTPDGPKFSYEPVDVSLIPPRERHYDVEKSETIHESKAAPAPAGPADNQD
jgi:succinate dehydrogenase / fumarate reductase flavoprotein subunit